MSGADPGLSEDAAPRSATLPPRRLSRQATLAAVLLAAWTLFLAWMAFAG
ncbi:hypothetical protein [Pseudobythopirellula maris]|nr:hypothetical protein [Pseudobythopirellula maris]